MMGLSNSEAPWETPPGPGTGKDLPRRWTACAVEGYIYPSRSRRQEDQTRGIRFRARSRYLRKELVAVVEMKWQLHGNPVRDCVGQYVVRTKDKALRRSRDRDGVVRLAPTNP